MLNLGDPKPSPLTGRRSSCQDFCENSTHLEFENWRVMCMLLFLMKIMSDLSIHEATRGKLGWQNLVFLTGLSGTDNSTISRRIISEQCSEFRSALYLLFNNFYKASDSQEEEYLQCSVQDGPFCSFATRTFLENDYIDWSKIMWAYRNCEVCARLWVTDRCKIVLVESAQSFSRYRWVFSNQMTVCVLLSKLENKGRKGPTWSETEFINRNYLTEKSVDNKRPYTCMKFRSQNASHSNISLNKVNNCILLIFLNQAGILPLYPESTMGSNLKNILCIILGSFEEIMILLTKL